MKKQIGIIFALMSLFYVSCDEEENTVPDNDNLHEGYEYVDLGLPSGALWATSDVEVNGSPFFSWGETQPKSTYSSATYKYAAGADSTLTKYSTAALCGDGGFIDGVFKLQLEDDAAHANWGGDWCTPTWSEWQELYDNCTWETTEAEDGTFVFVGTSKLNGRKSLSRPWAPCKGRICSMPARGLIIGLPRFAGIVARMPMGSLSRPVLRIGKKGSAPWAIACVQ